MFDTVSIAESIWARIPSTPFAFLGFGLFRAWTEINYINAPLEYPIQTGTSYLLFDAVTFVTLIVLALFSGKIAPLSRRRFVMPITALLLVACTCLNFGSLYVPLAGHPLLTFVSSAVGAVGTALFLMLWSEFFGCLNPLRVTLYYATGIMLAVPLAWLLTSLETPSLWAMTCLLPVVLMLCLWRAYTTLTRDDLPNAPTQRFSFPWKPCLVVVLYVFANGMQIGMSEGVLGTNSNVGALVGAAVIYVAVAARRDDFDFSLIWKVALPAMLVSFVALGLGVPFGGEAASVFSSMGYTMLLVLMMAILSNMSYRYGVCALWLFSIERAVRLVSNQAGLMTGDFFKDVSFAFPEASSIVSTVLFVALVVGATLFFMSEKQIASSWGVVLKQPMSHDLGLALEKSRLGVRCHELSQEHDLTGREEEVLLLLFQQRKLSDMAAALCIEKSTVKTHVKHIYQKLDVHSRKELLALVEMPDESEQLGDAVAAR